MSSTSETVRIGPVAILPRIKFRSASCSKFWRRQKGYATEDTHLQCFRQRVLECAIVEVSCAMRVMVTPLLPTNRAVRRFAAKLQNLATEWLWECGGQAWLPGAKYVDMAGPICTRGLRIRLQHDCSNDQFHGILFLLIPSKRGRTPRLAQLVESDIALRSRSVSISL